VPLFFFSFFSFLCFLEDFDDDLVETYTTEVGAVDFVSLATSLCGTVASVFSF
jgi:hypothetical protein